MERESPSIYDALKETISMANANGKFNVGGVTLPVPLHSGHTATPPPAEPVP